MMKLEKLNTWLGFFGQIAVLAGLIALAIEIRGNTLALRAQELAAIADREAERQLAMTDPQLRSIYVKSLYSPSDLTIDDLVAINAYMSYRVTQLEQAFAGLRSGILRESDWEAALEGAPMFLGTSFGQKWWQVHKDDYATNPQFVDAVERSLEESEIVPDDEYFIQLQTMFKDAGK